MANYYTLYSVCFPFLRQRLAWKVFSLFFKYQIKLAWHPFSCNGDGYLYDGLGWNEENWSSRVHLRIRMNSWWWFSRLDLVNGVLRWCEMIVMSTWCVTTLRLTKLGSWCECYGLNGESISTLMTVEEVRTWIISISCGLTWVMQKGNCVQSLCSLECGSFWYCDSSAYLHSRLTVLRIHTFQIASLHNSPYRWYFRYSSCFCSEIWWV